MSYHFHFGTAGIRAHVGPSSEALNPASVRAIADGIAGALLELARPADMQDVCVAFDGRADSRDFADLVCGVLLAHSFRVHAFDRETPTPVLAHAVRLKGALAGVMITASHNPAGDNGIKLYTAGGRQIGAPLDARIEARIARFCEDRAAEVADLARARSAGRLQKLGQREVEAYLTEVLSLMPPKLGLALPKIAYSALCGVGGEVTRALFARVGASDVAEVAAQRSPRADFGGLKSPNPEAPEALAQLHQLATQEDALCAFAHDPDADRLAVLARGEDGVLRTLSGDEVGALIGDFVLSQCANKERVLCASSLVSGGLLEHIVAARGAHYLRTRTGFKWIAAEGRAHAEREGLELLFGYEEALGYAFFRMADDKDGIAALHVMIELVRRLHAEGKSLVTRLAELATLHGVFATRPLSVTAANADDADRLMQRLRRTAAASLLGEGATLMDHALDPEPYPLLVFEDPRGTRVCVRPSGTEPKLKLYLHAREDAAPNVDAARQRAALRLDALERTLRPLLAP